MHLQSMFLLSFLGVHASTKADLLRLGSHYLCSMYWCMYLLNDCFPNKLSWEGLDAEIITLPDILQDCALTLCSDVLPQTC